MKNASFICLILVSLISVSTNCGSAPSPDEFQKYLSDPQALRVFAQICLPDKTAYFDTKTVDVTNLPPNISRTALEKLFFDVRGLRDGNEFINPYRSDSTDREYQTVRIWRTPVNPTDFPNSWIAAGEAKNVKGIKSAGSMAGGYLVDSTEKNQPVFSGHVGERPDDIIALSVSLPKNEFGEQRQFWFKLPKKISKDKYTDWISPVSEEGNSERSAKFATFWLLTHDKELPVYKVGENAPMMRYILMNFKEQNDYSNFGRRAINAARLQAVIDKPMDYEDHYHVPGKRESIPPCSSAP